MNKPGRLRVLNEGSFYLLRVHNCGGDHSWCSCVQQLKNVGYSVLFQHVCSLFLAVEVNNGVKKEVSSKDVARIWANEEIKMRSFSPVNVRMEKSQWYMHSLSWACSQINLYVLF